MADDVAARIAELTAKMLNLKLFVIISRGKGLDLRPHLVAHLEYMVGLERDGRLFASGPMGPTGSGNGLTILRVTTEEEARAIALADPFVTNGIRDFTVETWTLMEGSLNVALNFADGSMRLS
jgi:uncharacterized protein YciI